MKKQPIHQNLNTSFVNVGALVRYLRSLQFVGSIRIELASYEAEIIFTESNTIRAREYDPVAGRISHGEQALQRILIRAREPHGRIHVYKASEGYTGRDDGSIFVDKAIMNGAREMARNNGGTGMTPAVAREIVLSGRESENALVLAALSELLRVIDESLAKGNLSFPAAFRVACEAISSQFGFVSKTRDAIVYKNGEVKVKADADSDDVVAAVFAALRPIFARLRREVKYKSLLRSMVDEILELSTERRLEFVKLGIMNHVEQLLAGE